MGSSRLSSSGTADTNTSATLTVDSAYTPDGYGLAVAGGDGKSFGNNGSAVIGIEATAVFQNLENQIANS